MKSRIFVLFMLCAAAFAQDDSTLQSRLEAAWKGKVLQLRVFTDENDISLDATGKPAQDVKAGAWTTSLIKVQSVALEKDRLKITGKRFGIEFTNGFETVAYQDLKKKLTIRLAEPTAGWPSQEEMQRILFASSKEELQPLVPDLWCHYFGQCDPPSLVAGPHNAPARVGGNVSPPKAESAPDPSYSKYAQQAGLGGTAVMWLIVDTDGRMRQIRVARPLGLGLDEKAAEAISKWKFMPAMRDGVPVAVEMNVEVGFHLY